MQNKIQFDKALAQRFVNDMNLPIQVIDETSFYYWLSLYEPHYHSMTLWVELWDEIYEDYDGDVAKFLDNYYVVRDKVIETVIQSKAFKKFNTCDMKQFKIKTPLNPRNKDLYKETNVNKRFLSFDLIKSNIQALNYASPEILNAKTYDEFISKFTKSRYIAKSKYFRQVVFGQMNPSRHVTIAKYLISKVYEICRKYRIDYELVAVSSDEIVFEVPNDITNDFLYNLSVLMPTIFQTYLGLNVRVTYFKLYGYHLKTENCSNVATFYLKSGGNVCAELKGVPLQFTSVVYKLMRSNSLEPYDFVFVHDRCQCKFEEIFSIEQIENNEE